MKKSLIALAVVSTFAAQAAMADNTTIYGSANVSFDAMSSGVIGNSQSTNHVASNVSKLGFKGSEDLGDGLSAIWQIEEQINFASSGQSQPAAGTATNSTNSTISAASGASNFTSRDTFVGLSSTSLGTVIAGIHDTPYKMATRGYDLFADNIADNRSIMGTTVGDLRLNNVVAYISPAMSGFTIAAATISGAEVASAAGVTKGGAYSLALLYGAGPISASLAYQKIDVGSVGTGTTGGLLGAAAGDSVNATKIGGGYDFGVGLVNLVWEKEGSGGTIGNALDRTSWYLSGKYNVNGNDAVKAAYTKAGNVNSAAATGANQFSIGYDHNLSKHTTVYALYTKLNNDANQKYTFSQASDASLGAPATTNGASPSAWSLGLKHAF